MNAQDPRYCVKIKAKPDVKTCFCVKCERELVGLCDRDQAHHLGLPVVVYILDRPYCPACSLPEGAKQMTCRHCGERPFVRDMRVETKIVGTFPDQVEQVRYYCLWCSICAPASYRPRSLAERTDVTQRTKAPGTYSAAMSQDHDNATAASREAA